MARKAKKSKGMGIKTSVKSGNFLPTSKGAGMTAKGVCHIVEQIQVLN